MPDDDAFLRAILDDPDDDLPRLVYADWLDERGDPERAEFIRLECEFWRPRDRRAADPDRLYRLSRRADALLDRHRDRWVGPLAELVEFAAFRRGFVYHVTLSAAAFRAHAGRIWALAPVGRVSLTNAWEVIDKLAATPHLGRVEELDLGANHLGDDEARVLFGCPYLARLRSLDVSRNRFGGGAVVALAGCPALAGLRALNLSRNGITAAGVSALAASPYLKQLTELDLSDGGVGPEGVEAVAGGAFPALERLRLAGNRLPARGVRALVHGRGLERLRALDLAGGATTDEQRAALDRRFGPGVCVFD